MNDPGPLLALCAIPAPDDPQLLALTRGWLDALAEDHDRTLQALELTLASARETLGTYPDSELIVRCCSTPADEQCLWHERENLIHEGPSPVPDWLETVIAGKNAAMLSSMAAMAALSELNQIALAGPPAAPAAPPPPAARHVRLSDPANRTHLLGFPGNHRHIAGNHRQQSLGAVRHRLNLEGRTCRGSASPAACPGCHGGTPRPAPSSPAASPPLTASRRPARPRAGSSSVGTVEQGESPTPGLPGSQTKCRRARQTTHPSPLRPGPTARPWPTRPRPIPTAFPR